MQGTFDLHNPHALAGPNLSAFGPRIEVEITRGRARYRRRPVYPRAYLIGTAADCDLVLGDARFPNVHAYLLRGPRSATIRWLGEGPELMVNDCVAHESVRLGDQDLLRTACYEFRIHLSWPHGHPDDEEDYRLVDEDGEPRRVCMAQRLGALASAAPRYVATPTSASPTAPLKMHLQRRAESGRRGET